MPVLGIDPSLTCTGLALTGSPMTQLHRVTTAAPRSLSLENTRERIRYIVGNVLKFAPAECFTVIEAPVIPQHGAGQVLERAWLFGFLVDQMMMRGPVVQVRPKTRAKYAAGNGNAKKPAVLAAMRAMHPAALIVDDNVADALALAGMGARHLGAPISGDLSKAQAAAMSAVVWPNRVESK